MRDAAWDIGVEVDPTVPPGVAELRDGERVVGRIVGLDKLRKSVLDSAIVVFEDERVSYVEIQVDRAAWLQWVEANRVC